MAKQTGQITVLKNNTVTNVEHQIRFIFAKENGGRITRDTTAKGVINFDIPNGDWNVSWFAVGGDQKVLPLRAGLQLKITSSTPTTALADWIYGDNTHVADPILAQWTSVLDEMKAVRDEFRKENSFVGTGKIMREGAYGIGALLPPKDPENINAASEKHPGFSNIFVDSAPSNQRPININGHLQGCFNYTGSYGAERYIISRGTSWRRGWVNGSPTKWYLDYGEDNTIVDSNGFIKVASPVINLFSDRIEPNNHFSQEYEKAPIFEKLSVGVYKISNTKGLAKGEYAGDWYIETPKNVNGDPYFNTEWQQLEDNTVIIRTYEREEFTEEYQRYDENGNALIDTQDNVLKFYQRHEINGEPIDIKDGRFIALRFLEDEEAKAKREADHKAQMQKEQEEFEEQERLRKEAEEQEQAEATAAWEAEMARQEAEMIAEMEGAREVVAD